MVEAFLAPPCWHATFCRAATFRVGCQNGIASDNSGMATYHSHLNLHFGECDWRGEANPAQGYWNRFVSFWRFIHVPIFVLPYHKQGSQYKLWKRSTGKYLAATGGVYTTGVCAVLPIIVKDGTG